MRASTGVEEVREASSRFISYSSFSFLFFCYSCASYLYTQNQGHHGHNLKDVFDLKDDNKWPFGFKPHPALKFYTAIATARITYANIQENVNKEEILTEFPLWYIPDTEISDIKNSNSIKLESIQSVKQSLLMVLDTLGGHGILKKGIYKGREVAIKIRNPEVKCSLDSIIKEARNLMYILFIFFASKLTLLLDNSDIRTQ